MTKYLLEFRLSGLARRYLKNLVIEVSREFKVTGATSNRVVPHVTLVGPFTTVHEKRLVRSLLIIGRKYHSVPFTISDFGSFGNWLTGRRVLFARIEPSAELNALHSDLLEGLKPFCNLNKTDSMKFEPHATIAFKDIDNKFGKIKDFLSKKNSPTINHHVLRITLLRGNRILCEYDLFLRRLLSRSEALDRRLLSKTKTAVRRRA